MEFVPQPIQIPMMDFLANVPKGALWASMGTGKTAVVLWLLSIYRFVNSDPVLIVGPKRVVRDVWLPEIEKWSEMLQGMTASLILGSGEERCRAAGRKADIYLINYENLPWLYDTFYKKNKFFACIVVADEATRLKGFKLRCGGVQAKAFYLMSRKADRVIELTGTPVPNGFIDLWGQLYILDQGLRLGRTLDAYKARWFDVINCGSFNKIRPKAAAAAEIPERIKDVCLTVRSEDYYDLKEIIVRDIDVYLPDKLRSVYKKAEKEMYALLESGREIRAFNAADCTVKCLQISNGAVYTDRDRKEFEVLHDEKLNALESIVEETNGANLLVAYHFKHDLIRLIKRFPQGVELEDKPGFVDRWNEGRIPLMFLHPGSAGHGLNLQYGGNIIVFFGNWWNMDQREQVIERIGPMRQLRAGFNRNVYQYNIVTKNTVDERVLFSHANKCSINEALMNQTK